MAGTRTAPDITLAANRFTYTLHLIDASGDTYTETIVSATAILAANLESWAADYQAVTQASVYGFSSTTEWVGDADPDNATTDQRNSVKDGINMLFKNPASLLTYNVRVIAPILGVLQGNQDIPLLTQADMTALILLYGTSLIPGWNMTSAQYTERRERKNNPRVK